MVLIRESAKIRIHRLVMEPIKQDIAQAQQIFNVVFRIPLLPVIPIPHITVEAIRNTAVPQPKPA